MRTRASTANENRLRETTGRMTGLTKIKEEESLSSLGSSILTDDDGDTVMGDDEERPQTPTPLDRFDPGSVLLTPNKNKPRGQSDAQAAADGDRHSGHSNRTINDRVAFLRDPSLALISQPAAPEREDEDRPVSERKRKKRLAFREDPSVHIIPACPSIDENDEPGPSEPQAGPSTEDRSSATPEESDDIVSEWHDSVRWFRDRKGAFVRDGSLPPECFYHWQFPKSMQPPRADPAECPPERPTPPRLQRTDTELIIDAPKPSRQAQHINGAQPIAREHSVILEKPPTPPRKAKEVQQLPTPRRSERIRKLRAEGK